MSDFRPHHYANELKLGGNHASDRSLVYRWNGVFWDALPDKAGEAYAYRWLVEHDHANASPRNASAAHQASILWLDELPTAGTSELFVPCQNGYVKCVGADLELIEPSPELGLQFALACHYIPGHERTRFEKFLDSVLPDREVQARVQEYVGYTLTCDARYLNNTVAVFAQAGEEAGRREIHHASSDEYQAPNPTIALRYYF